MDKKTNISVKKINILDLEQTELKEFLQKLGYKTFHAVQITKWIYRGAAGFDTMSDLSKDLREILAEKAEIGALKQKKILESADEGTVKFLFGLPDGNVIESVLMKYHHGPAACISSQIGCKMGCEFCASSKAAFSRNLTAGEMAEQVILMGRYGCERISSVVVMGIGEPLDNYENLVRFLKIINAKDGLNIGYRHITVSTCGLVPQIIRLSKEGLPINLSLSLHASNDSTRSRLMPINGKYSIDKTVEACKIYSEATKRRITFEYALIGGLNDSRTDALELSKRLKGLMCHVNLIHLNEVEGIALKKSSAQKELLFKKVLESAGIPVTVRRKLGDDIEAACGQLRRREIKDGEC